MKFTKKEAVAVANACYGRHTSPEHAVADMLMSGKLGLGELAYVIISAYRAFHPKLITGNFDNRRATADYCKGLIGHITR
jgi:hypothetical protein